MVITNLTERVELSSATAELLHSVALHTAQQQQSRRTLTWSLASLGPLAKLRRAPGHVHSPHPLMGQTADRNLLVGGEREGKMPSWPWAKGPEGEGKSQVARRPSFFSHDRFSHADFGPRPLILDQVK